MSQPSAVTLSDTGALAFVTLQGNNRLIVLNQVGQELARNDTGLAPGGVVIDPVTQRVFTQDLMSRTVTVFDGAPVMSQAVNQLPRLAQVNTVAVEKMSAAVLKGKQIFYNAADPRMSRDAYISCASCHVDGDQDGQVWDFTDRGEGLRNTTSLRGQGGQATAPLHWSGNFDEVQDFENDIRQFFGGTGFMANADFNSGTRNQPLGTPKAGVSADLDALAAYVNSLTNAGRSPKRQSNGAMTANASAGLALFAFIGMPVLPQRRGDDRSAAARRGHAQAFVGQSPRRAARRHRHPDAARAVGHGAVPARRLGGDAARRADDGEPDSGITATCRR